MKIITAARRLQDADLRDSEKLIPSDYIHTLIAECMSEQDQFEMLEFAEIMESLGFTTFVSAIMDMGCEQTVGWDVGVFNTEEL